MSGTADQGAGRSPIARARHRAARRCWNDWPRAILDARGERGRTPRAVPGASARARRRSITHQTRCRIGRLDASRAYLEAMPIKDLDRGLPDALAEVREDRLDAGSGGGRGGEALQCSPPH